ncbi:MAG: hypothetical protein N2109_03215 [Fimbriimonadales bacterium]|nr:hypothetical protein [Fimbriimonadales bacterium]
MRLVAVLLATGSLAGLGWTRPEEARPLADRVVRSLWTARYSGERTVELLRGLQRVRHSEIVHKDGAKTRVEYLAGSPLEGTVVVEDGRRRYVVRPSGEGIEEGPARGDDAARRLAAMLSDRERFALRIRNGEIVAGLPSRVLEVVDRRGILAQRLWVHPPSGVVLKRELFGPAGRRLGGFEFRRIELNPRFEPGLFDPPGLPAARAPVLERLRALSREAGFLPAHLSPRGGFRLDAVMVRRIAGRRVLVQVYRGREGLVTLYQLESPGERLEALQPDPGLSFHAWERSGRSFVLIGEPPAGRLRELAASLVVR